MNTDLPQMHDIILPTFQEHLWPLPVGYWIGLITLMVVSIGSAFAVVHYRRKYKARSQALKSSKQCIITS